MFKIALFVFNSGQPALLYLSPMTVGPLVYYAWKIGDLQDMWIGRFSNN